MTSRKKNLITEVVDNMDGSGASVRRIDEVDVGAPRPIVPSDSDEDKDADKEQERQDK